MGLEAPPVFRSVGSAFGLEWGAKSRARCLGRASGPPCVREVVASLRNPQPVIELHVGGEQGLPS